MLSTILIPLTLLSAVSASPVEPSSPLDPRQLSVTPYGPSLVACPSEDLVRAASGGVNPSEAQWVTQRKKKATNSLKTWLASTGANFPTLANNQYPTMAYVNGGGGLRGFLISAGVHKAFDSNEKTKTPMSGLYQSMTYDTGLSGSSASLASYANNDWPTTSSLQSQLWEPGFQNGLLNPNGGDPATLASITADIAAKAAAGFPVTVVDAFGRLISYASLLGDDGGVDKRYSDLLNYAGYTSHNRPYPIITAIGVEDPQDGCGLPRQNATQFEFTPHEFGSWETDIGNFMNTKYLGTRMLNGNPALLGLACTNGFDNVGWITGTSSDTFNQNCGKVENMVTSSIGFAGPEATSAVKGLVGDLLGTGILALYSLLPNPFSGLDTAPRVADLPTLRLIDGGETLQVPPIWPLLYRPDVSVLFVSDNSADDPKKSYPGKSAFVNYPSGAQLFRTQTQARANGVGNRMPTIPNQTRFQNLGLNKKTTFFGCNQPAGSDAFTIIYMPNRDISFNSDQPAGRLQYNVADTRGMVQNGVNIATDNNSKGFNTCVGCALMKKSAAQAGKALPAACAGCFKKYCYN